jgi:GNAT superfamily N-acetyltransferase
MSSQLSTIERLSTPDIEFAQLAQVIGLQATAQQLEPTRTEDVVRHMFNPDPTSGNAGRLLSRMQEKDGLFVGVIASVDEQAVGYAWAAEDVSGSPLAQFAKSVLLRRLPYAWLAQINVLPEFQGKGIGSSLMRAVYEPFRNDLITTTYVFKENPRVLEWFGKRGMTAEEPPEPKYDYFGKTELAVDQYRMVGEKTLRLRNTVKDLQGRDAWEFDLIQRNTAA